MNHVRNPDTLPARPALRALAGAVLAMACLAAWAAPGAHGPGGEHLDTPAAAAAGAGAGGSRVEAKSDLFELVATLQGGELSMLIDRFATNEPVLDAQVEVESGALKAKATFHADIGDYAVDDPAFLKALAAPGEHALVVTIVAGKESDLLDATLVVAKAPAGQAAPGHDPGHAHGNAHEDAHAAGHGSGTGRTPWAIAAVLGVALIAALLWWRRRRPDAAATVKEAL